MSVRLWVQVLKIQRPALTAAILVFATLVIPATVGTVRRVRTGR